MCAAVTCVRCVDVLWCELLGTGRVAQEAGRPHGATQAEPAPKRGCPIGTQSPRKR